MDSVQGSSADIYPLFTKKNLEDAADGFIFSLCLYLVLGNGLSQCDVAGVTADR